jgi:F420H(2)-dependent quinone reductase
MPLVAKAFLWLHTTLYRLTNGRIGGRFIAGSPILPFTTTGRRTGKQRTRPLAYVRDADRFVLCASNGGSPHHPAWYHNLRGGWWSAPPAIPTGWPGSVRPGRTPGRGLAGRRQPGPRGGDRHRPGRHPGVLAWLLWRCQRTGGHSGSLGRGLAHHRKFH